MSKKKNNNVSEPSNKKETKKDIKLKKEVEDLQLQLQESQEHLEAEKDRNLRLFAEFENYKKRTNKERIELIKTAGEEIIHALLPVVDDFDRALLEIQKIEDPSQFQGIQLIYTKFKNTLVQRGLEEIEVKAGDDFDSEIHDAVTQITAPTDDLKGKIVDVVEKGYRLADKIIRHPKVVVGQ